MENPVLNEAKRRAANYCAYTERCDSEVRRYLAQKGYDEEIVSLTIDFLEVQNFLNTDRYLRAFVRGKSRSNRWGKKRIAAKLAEKGFSQTDIAPYLADIDAQTYRNTLKTALEKKVDSYRKKSRNRAELQRKLGAYAYSKGYEYDISRRLIEEILKE